MLSHVQASNKRVQPLAAPRLDQDGPPTCGNESLEGTYGVSLSGTRPAPPPLSGTPSYVPGTIEQLIGVGTQTFDGAGNFTQVTNEKGALSGIIVPNRAGHGTYTVNADCSGTLALTLPGLPFTIMYDIAIVNHGKEVRGIVVSPQPVMISTVAQRVN